MKKYLFPILFTVVIIALLVFAVRASVSNSNDAKSNEASPSSTSLTNDQKDRLKQGQTTGNTNAKVVVSEFADFQCPACKAFEPAMRKVREQYPNDVLVVFKHFPLYPQPHKNAQVAAIAAEAAGVQGKFWQFHDVMYDKQDDWAELDDPKSKFADYAQSIGMDVDKFKKDLDAEINKNVIEADKKFGTEIGIKGTPTIYINGVQVDLQADGGLDGFQAKVKAAVEQANGSGQ